MEIKKEQWKDIKGYIGFYQVSEFGDVKSLKRVVTAKNDSIKKNKEKILKHGISNDGYRVVSLSKKGVIKSHRIHRLVAQAFIPNPLNKPLVHHINGDKLCNIIWNLEWVTAKENRLYYIDEISNKYIRKENKFIKNRNGKNAQELIKVYDIAMLRSGYTFRVEEIKDNKVYDRLGDRGFGLQDITKILTPHGKDYICQWEAN